MIIGIPQELSFQGSNVIEETPTFEELLRPCQPPVFDEELKILSGNWIYEYEGVEFTPKLWTLKDEEDGVYELDEIIFKDCKLFKVTGKDGDGLTRHQRPKQPEEYSGWDFDMDFANWSHRYVKVKSTPGGQWLAMTWDEGDMQYSVVWNNPRITYDWVIRDKRARGLHKNHIKWSGRYRAGNDMKAVVIKWSASAQLEQEVITFKSLIEREGWYFLRTHLDLPLEYNTWTTGTAFQYSYLEIKSAEDIEGFKRKELSNPYRPFDGKNYTAAIVDTGDLGGYARWDVLCNDSVDSVALGHIVCDFVDVRFSDQDGNILFQINRYPIDNSVAKNRDEIFPTTRIIYSDKTMPPGTIMTVVLWGKEVKIGEIMGATKLEAGFTKVDFKNSFKDFSPKEQDQWGNWYYKNGIKVHLHSGTVELPITNYDQLNRLMVLVGGQKVAINSSDSVNNTIPDGKKVFDATMMIGRFLNLDLASKNDKKRIGDYAKYTFKIEELV